MPITADSDMICDSVVLDLRKSSSRRWRWEPNPSVSASIELRKDSWSSWFRNMLDKDRSKEMVVCAEAD